MTLLMKQIEVWKSNNDKYPFITRVSYHSEWIDYDHEKLDSRHKSNSVYLDTKRCKIMDFYYKNRTL
jgi:hypothetical protein